MVSLSRPLAFFGNPRAGKLRGNWHKFSCQNVNIGNTQYIFLMMGNIRPLARFLCEDRKYIFHMTGYRYCKLKMTFTLNEWAVGKLPVMAQ